MAAGLRSPGNCRRQCGKFPISSKKWRPDTCKWQKAGGVSHFSVLIVTWLQIIWFTRHAVDLHPQLLTTPPHISSRLTPLVFELHKIEINHLTPVFFRTFQCILRHPRTRNELGTQQIYCSRFLFTISTSSKTLNELKLPDTNSIIRTVAMFVQLTCNTVYYRKCRSMIHLYTKFHISPSNDWSILKIPFSRNQHHHRIRHVLL